MADQNASRCGGTSATPTEGATLTFTAAQVDYLRELVFEDLADWARMLERMAVEASETAGCHTAAADADAACHSNDRPHMATLDVLGWEHPDHLAERLERQRERARS